MVANQGSLAKEGFHEPLQYEWRVTGYFRPDLLEGYIHKMAKGTYKYLRRKNWPPTELHYKLSKVEPLPEYSREQLDQFALQTEPKFSALKVRITVVCQKGHLFVPMDAVDLSESLFRCMFGNKDLGGNFYDSLPIGGEEAANHFFSEVYPHITDALKKAIEEEPLRGAGTAHVKSSHLYPAFAIVHHIGKLSDFPRNTQAHPLAVKKADNVKPTDPEDVRSAMAQLREDYLKYHEDSQRTTSIVVACNEETMPKAINNAVTNIGLMEGSIRDLIGVVETHLGKSVQRPKSRFFVKRWIMDMFSVTDSDSDLPTICLDSSYFDVVQCKRALRNRLTHYQRMMRSLVTCIRFLDPATCAAYNKVVDSTPNTPDKAECLSMYGYNGTREQAERSIERIVKTVGFIHGKILEQLDLLIEEIARTIATTSVECWWDCPDEKGSDVDDEEYYKAHLVAASRP